MKISIELDTSNGDEQNPLVFAILNACTGAQVGTYTATQDEAQAVTTPEPAKRTRRTAPKAGPTTDVSEDIPKSVPLSEAEEPTPDASEPEPEFSEGKTLQDAVDVATKLVSAGKAAEVKTALAEFGAKRVSELKGVNIEKFCAALS